MAPANLARLANCYPALYRYEVPQEAWVVLGIVVFGVIFILGFTWIMFIFALCKTNKHYREMSEVVKVS